jgi:hypothetical protein
MSVKKFAAQLADTVEGIKADGHEAIKCDNLIAYLKEVQESGLDDPSAREIETYKAHLQHWVEQHKHRQGSELELFRSVISAGQGAIKSMFLLNGGASVAMLAFIGHLAEKQPSKVPGLAACLLPFVLGVLCVSSVSAFTYLSQWLYAGRNKWAKGFGFGTNVLCIVLGIGAHVLFAWGLYVTYRALVAYN